MREELGDRVLLPIDRTNEAGGRLDLAVRHGRLDGLDVRFVHDDVRRVTNTVDLFAEGAYFVRLIHLI